MLLRRRIILLISALGAALAVAAGGAAPALASGSMPTSAVGTDISWPQCGKEYPTGYNFGIVGVTGGRPFSTNDCFASQFAWASNGMLPAQLYVNLDYGKSSVGPLECLDGEDGCLAYNYGYSAAASAYRYAARQTRGASRAVDVWWLDVETDNYWSEDALSNSYVIQGALDYLQRSMGKTVGVYSTPHQWWLIAGSFAPPQTPTWIAGAGNLDDFVKCYAQLWPGSAVWAIQYLNFDIDLDQNRAC
jgi:hypothetical protein